MKFKNKYGTTIYCKDNSYQKKYDTDNFYYKNRPLTVYYKGYLLHRENGPALEFRAGDNWLFLNGKNYSEKEYYNIVNLKKKMDILDEV